MNFLIYFYANAVTHGLAIFNILLKENAGNRPNFTFQIMYANCKSNPTSLKRDPSQNVHVDRSALNQQYSLTNISFIFWFLKKVDLNLHLLYI